MRETEKRIRMYQAQLPFAKEKVIASLLIFAFSIAMITMTAFAWTTLSVAPEVSGATTTITSNGNLEIALAGNYTIQYATNPEGKLIPQKNEKGEPILNTDSTTNQMQEKDQDGNLVYDADGNPVYLVQNPDGNYVYQYKYTIDSIVPTPPKNSAVGDSLLSIQDRNQTWGNLINLSDPSYGLDHIILRPAALNTGSVAKNPFVSAQYGSDGRVTKETTDFKYAVYDSVLGAFVQSDLPGVKAVSHVKLQSQSLSSKIEVYYSDMLEHVIPNSLVQARNALLDVVAQMDMSTSAGKNSPLSGLMGAYLNGILYDNLDKPNDNSPADYSPMVCNPTDMQGLYDLMDAGLNQKVLKYAGEAFVEMFYLYQLDTYVDKGIYDAWVNDPSKGEFIWPSDKTGTQNFTRFEEDSTGFMTEKGMDDFCAQALGLLNAMNQERAGDKQIPQSFIDTVKKFASARTKLTAAIDNLKVQLNDNTVYGNPIYWYEVAEDVNNLVNIQTTKINGKTLTQWFSNIDYSEVLGMVMGDEKSNTAVVYGGAIFDIDSLLYETSGIKIGRIDVNVEKAAMENRFGMGMNATVKANVKTDIIKYDEYGEVIPSISVQALDAASDVLATGYVVYEYIAKDTYGLAIDFWLRTNVPSSSLRLEGEVIFKENPVTKQIGEDTVYIYLATIVRTTTKNDGSAPFVETIENVEVYKKNIDGETVWFYTGSSTEVEVTEELSDSAGLRVTEISGTPEQCVEREAIGYRAGNRIWESGDLPAGYEAQYSTSQGSGSCYTFYADPTEKDTILSVLKLMRVAFVDANGEVLAIAKLETEYCFSEAGKHLVPLVLYDKYDERVGTDLDGSEKTFRTIMDLTTNEPTLISALVYLEGDSIENKDVLSSADIKGQFNIQFATTYNENALKDEALMYEKIIVSAELADKSQDGTTYVKTLTATIAGADANSVQANFIRKISSTQGTLCFTKAEDITLTKVGGVWVGDFTFTTPGTYVLRSLTVDGQERMLQEERTFKIDGFGIKGLTSERGVNYTVLKAESSYTEFFSVTLSASSAFKDMAKNATVKGIFSNEDNVNIEVNFKKGTMSEVDGTVEIPCTASVTFNTSGKYTLQYLLVDGQYYEVAESEIIVRDISLGLKAEVWLTAPRDFTEAEEHRYDFDKGIHTYFYMQNKHEFGVSLKIYDESGRELKYLGGAKGVELHYGTETVLLKWNASAKDYSGSGLLLENPGTYAFKEVILLDTEQSITVARSAPRVIVANKDPYTFIRVEDILITEFNSVLNSNPTKEEYPSVNLLFENASSATMYGKFKIIDKDGTETYKVVPAEMYDKLTNTQGYFSFRVPLNKDAIYQLVEVKFTNVTKVKGGQFYQSTDDLSIADENGIYSAFDAADESSGFLTMKFDGIEYPELDTIKIAATITPVIENVKTFNPDSKSTLTYSGAFLQEYALFDGGKLVVYFTDFEGNIVTGLSDLNLKVKHNGIGTLTGYTISQEDYNAIAANTTFADGMIVSANADGKYVFDKLPSIYLTGTYSVYLNAEPESSSINDQNKATAMEEAILKTALPTQLVVETTALPTVKITDVDTGNNKNNTVNDTGTIATVYVTKSTSKFLGFLSTLNHFKTSSVSITLSNSGYAKTATMPTNVDSELYSSYFTGTGSDKTEDPKAYSWTAASDKVNACDSAAKRWIGYSNHGVTKGSEGSYTKLSATAKATTLVLTDKYGYEFTVDITEIRIIHGDVK